MAPRKPKPLTVNEAQGFDFDAFVSGFKRPEFTRNLYQRADLLPRLSELDEATNELQLRLDKVEAAQGDDEPERSVTDVDLATTLRTRLEAQIEEFNAVYEAYEASAVAFTFRVPDRDDDWPEIRKLMTAQGVDPGKVPDSSDEPALVAWMTAQAISGMTVTCTSHRMSDEQWQAFRVAVGDVAFASLVQAWNEAVKAALPSAPFSPKPLPGQRSGQSSQD